MRIFGLGKPKLTSDMTVGLTDTGKKMALRDTSKGRSYAIVASLNERSPQSLGELSEETQIDISEVKARIKVLARQGYVRFTGMEA